MTSLKRSIIYLIYDYKKIMLVTGSYFRMGMILVRITQTFDM